jgi:hypothetical protein
MRAAHRPEPPNPIAALPPEERRPARRVAAPAADPPTDVTRRVAREEPTEATRLFDDPARSPRPRDDEGPGPDQLAFDDEPTRRLP